MCGIFGAVTKKSSVNHLGIRGCFSQLGKRGPDSAGLVIIDPTSAISISLNPDIDDIELRLASFAANTESDNLIILGHTRLSIIDLSLAGSQPMISQDGMVWIVFNGEIFNYIELRGELAKLGYQFKTNTDTEVLLIGYQHFGYEILTRLNGMWSFAIYDQAKRIMFCAVDDFSIKPFYYSTQSTSGAEFCFASEPRALSSLGQLGFSPNLNAMTEYIASNLDPNGRETYFSNIFKIVGGAFLTCAAPNWGIVSRTWASSVSSLGSKKPDDEELLGLLSESVRLRLRSDVPVGTCLSGGIDSSAVLSLINRSNGSSNAGFHTFTSVFPDSEIDEKSYAERMVSFTGAAPTYVCPSARDLEDDLDSLIAAHGEPFQGLTVYSQYCLMRAVKSAGIKVILDGQGSDELFWGYKWHYIRWLKNEVKQGRIAIAASGLCSAVTQRDDFPLSDLLANFVYFSSPLLRKQRSKLRIRSLLLPERLNEWDRNVQRYKETDIRRVRSEELAETVLPRLLRYEDRNSMAFSIEARLPFLDQRLVRYSLQIDPRYLIKDGWGKAPLRSTLTGVLPPEILKRRNKLGFTVPDKNWMNSLRPTLIERFNSSPMLSGDLFQNNAVHLALMDQNIDPILLWRLVNIELWMRSWSMS
jgi:asparagine synthase (glutamine-hydrolysing)